MLMYYADGLKDETNEKRLSKEQFNVVYDFYGSLHKTKELALKDAVKFAKEFNANYGTNYSWEELSSISSDNFEWNAYERNWERI